MQRIRARAPIVGAFAPFVRPFAMAFPFWAAMKASSASSVGRKILMNS